MKKLWSITAVSAIFSTIALTSLSAQATPTLDTTTATPNDGILQNFTGIDWHSNGGGWIQGFDLTSANNPGDTDNFTLTYQAFAGVLQTTTPTPNLYIAAPGSATGGYELTIFSKLDEIATCLTTTCNTVQTSGTGTWDIYFDTGTDANQAAGTGFTNGVKILSGTWDSAGGIFTSVGGPVGPGALGTGSATLNGTVTYTNSSYITPDLLGTSFQSSLQFPGQSAPSYTRPSAFNGTNTGADSAQNFVMQIDGSQDFSHKVPEPAMLGLLGLGLLSMVGLRRKQMR